VLIRIDIVGDINSLPLLTSQSGGHHNAAYIRHQILMVIGLLILRVLFFDVVEIDGVFQLQRVRIIDSQLQSAVAAAPHHRQHLPIVVINAEEVPLFHVIALCLILSIGIGILFQDPINWENTKTLLLYISQCVVVSTVIYAVLLLIGGAALKAADFAGIIAAAAQQ
jgi:hypothetical protein